MKKELPKLYRGNIKSGISNNKRVARGLSEIKKSPRIVINELFKENEIYHQQVEIETSNKTVTTQIIGRTQEHIITIKNEVIKIDDIKKIELLK